MCEKKKKKQWLESEREREREKEEGGGGKKKTRDGLAAVFSSTSNSLSFPHTEGDDSLTKFRNSGCV